jgi:hypothetical protein|tara:strand:+ start:352 stop:1644 length:1293 start_codon:yes stop_codon:yes gene_type:complete
VPVSRNQPSPQRQTVLTFVSPNVQDLLFYETVDVQRVGRTPPAYGTAHPDSTKFPDHKLVYVKQADPNGQLYQYFYAASRSSQDNYNFEYSQASLGSSKFNTVVRTYVTPRSEFKEDDSTLEAGDAMPTDPSSANFSGKGYILMTRQQKRLGDQELDGYFVIEQRVYFVREDLETLRWDEMSGSNLKTTVSYFALGETPSGGGSNIQTLISDADNAYWSPTIEYRDADSTPKKAVAFYKEGRQVSSDWFEVVKTETIAGTTTDSAIDADTTLLIEELDTSVNYTFPPVLQDISVVNWERHDGQIQSNPEYHMNPEGYSGPCKAKVKKEYKVSEFDGASEVPSAKAMQPQSFSFSTPYISLRIPACLMNGGEVGFTTGTTDPVYKYTVYTKQLPVTEPSSWPTSIDVRVTQQNARGGFIKETTTVFPPSYN